MTDGEWYYCLLHRTVEPYGGCRADDRLGPYPTRAEAENALTHVAERNEEWETDPRFTDPDDEAEEGEGAEGWGPFRH